MAEKKYDHLVKRAKVREEIEGLYSNPRIWMEGDDLEGFEANFSYGFLKETGTIHPKEGAIVHPYDECLIFAGLNIENILDLGAKISIRIGEKGEKHTFEKPSVIVIPAGTPHGPVTVEEIDRPIAHYHVGLAPGYEAEEFEMDSEAIDDSDYAHLVKDLKTYVDEKLKSMMKGFVEICDDRGVMQLKDILGPGNADKIVWLFGKDLEGLDVNLPWGYYSQPGMWTKEGEPHKHENGAELLFFAGLDPDDVNSLGAEIEIALGEERERHVFDEPTAIIAPKKVPHCPLITRWVDKPYTHTTIFLDGEYKAVSDE